ncbi:MAG: hypothetical protein CDV28_12930 [Candidatus Electronema aureum]|uniref:Uncharacterized protein n=1 Tax=Candidatus Electronema aureum TaxID=2005002 RepID=A0A521G042_9BACT|nr:MAG: hypothetical protein CDV28_12930 [Candidatus Electronema aureum]
MPAAEPNALIWARLTTLTAWPFFARNAAAADSQQIPVASMQEAVSISNPFGVLGNDLVAIWEQQGDIELGFSDIDSENAD